MDSKILRRSSLIATLFLGGCAPIVIRDANQSSKQNDSEKSSMHDESIDMDNNKNHKQQDQTENKSKKSKLSHDEAKDIATNDAGVDADSAYFRVVKEYNNTCKLVFDDGGSVYVYKINLSTGDIIFSKRNEKGGGHYGNSENSGNYNYYSNDDNSSSENGDLIGADEAKRIIFDHLGIDEAEVYKLDVDFHQYRNYTPKYEIDFKYSGLEYECEVNAYTGDILEIDIDD